MLKPAFVIALFAVFALPRFARADPPGLVAAALPAPPVPVDNAPDDYGARSKLGVELGFAMPTGELGAEYTQHVATDFEIGFGTGIGLSHNVQLSVMPRIRMGHRGFAVTFGAGVSGGPNTLPECFIAFAPNGCMDTHASFVAWANAEVGAEWTRRTGLMFRMFVGYGRSFLAAACSGDECGQLAGWGLPYFGLQLGHTL